MTKPALNKQPSTSTPEGWRCVVWPSNLFSRKNEAVLCSFQHSFNDYMFSLYFMPVLCQVGILLTVFAEAQGFLRTTMGARVELSRLCLAATPSSQPEQLPFYLFYWPSS